MRLIRSKCCGKFAIYWCMKLVFKNGYHYHSLILLQNGDVTANIIHSREEVTQGYPLAMVDYGIGVIPLIKHLKLVNPDATKPWYAENTGALGTFDNLERYFNLLTRIGPAWRCYPDPIKFILILHLNNLEAGNCLARIMGLVYARAHVMSVVISGIANPKALGSKSGRINGR